MGFPPKFVQVHRFHEAVALFAGKGETVYLTPLDARLLGEALIIAADDAETRKFTESACGTFQRHCEDGRDFDKA